MEGNANGIFSNAHYHFNFISKIAFSLGEGLSGGFNIKKKIFN